MLDVAAAALMFTAYANVPDKYAPAPECYFGHMVSSADKGNKRLTECADDKNHHWIEGRKDGKFVKVIFRNAAEGRQLLKQWHKDDEVR